MRSTAPWFGLVLALLGGCKGEPFRPDAAIDAPQDAYDPPWWTPEQGEAKDWDTQLAPPFDTTEPRAMYLFDLWAVASATTLDYGDGTSVTVPAGPLDGTIAMLHARTPRPIVACRVRTGAVHLTRDPDAMKFPGYEASPPNKPDLPAEGSAIGWDTREIVPDPDERFLDLRTASRAAWKPYIWKRLDLAKQLGCDAIAADHNSHWIEFPTGSGFEITDDDQLSWFEDVATQIHARELSAGSVNGHEGGQPVDQLPSMYDWILIERCAENEECGNPRGFLDARKAVFAVDIVPDISKDRACAEYGRSMIQDGLLKDEDLTGGFRQVCD